MQDFGVASKTGKDLVNGALVRKPHQEDDRCPQILLDTGASGDNDFMNALAGRSGTELNNNLPRDMLACRQYCCP